MCDTVAIIERGRLLAVGTIDEIHRARQSHRTVQIHVLDDVEGLRMRLTARADVRDVVLKGAEVEFRHEGDQQFEADLLRDLITSGCRVVAFGSRAESLEDVFMRVTEGLVQ
jgi:ABC-2 type transport system ATP-binding protein